VTPKKITGQIKGLGSCEKKNEKKKGGSEGVGIDPKKGNEGEVSRGGGSKKKRGSRRKAKQVIKR